MQLVTVLPCTIRERMRGVIGHASPTSMADAIA